MIDISVIIPLAPEETAWHDLLVDLSKLPDGTEILFVTSQAATLPDETPILPNKDVRFLSSKPGRADQMNAGAKAAKGQFLWFLHADSKFAEDTLPRLLHGLQNHPASLLYFDLAFIRDATPLMFLNAWGVRFRSRILKVPFGDQGFCLARDLFGKLGGFPDHLPYGEDHIFVWKARQYGVDVQAVGAKLYTSARKYKKHGWLKTTFLHQYLWIQQAWPEWKKLKKGQAT